MVLLRRCSRCGGVFVPDRSGFQLCEACFVTVITAPAMQCRGTTKSGARCKVKISSVYEYCAQHEHQRRSADLEVYAKDSNISIEEMPQGCVLSQKDGRDETQVIVVSSLYDAVEIIASLYHMINTQFPNGPKEDDEPPTGADPDGTIDRGDPWAECPECAGDGWVTNALDGKEDCPVCNSTGKRGQLKEVPAPEALDKSDPWDDDLDDAIIGALP